jgi:zinc protease
MPRQRILAAALALALAPAASWGQKMTTSANGGSLPAIRFTEFKLENGLRVVLHEDHSTPIVAVNVWYHVGSKNEVPGKTGFAHLFEHMMFQGSKHHDNDYFKPLQEAGATLNGSTNADRTNYYQVVPSNFLELALWLESDRMGYLLDAMTEEKLANQRDVVKNEKRQRYDNQPYGLVGARISERLYPPDHPYHWLTIGSLDDLTAASMDDVKDFFRRYYVPNNASLTIAGDFDPTQTRRLVEKYFGPLRRGPEVKAVAAAQPRLDREIRESMEDRVSLPRLYVSWHTVPAWAADEPALDMLAEVLSGSKSSRLDRTLVFERQIAQNVSASSFTREIAGTFQITVTPKPGRTLEEVEKIVEAEIARIKAEPPAAEEIERAFNSLEAAFVYRLQSVNGKSDQLNQYAVFRDDPGAFRADLERYRGVTPADVQRAAQTYLTDKRYVLSVVPGRSAAMAEAGRRPQVPATPAKADAMKADVKPAMADAKPATQADSNDPLYTMPRAGKTPELRLPKAQSRRLSNGLEVLVVEHHELPVVGLNLVLRSGAEADPRQRGGLASLTADLLDEGTKTRSALDVANALDALGARLGTGADWDRSTVNLLTLSRHLGKALDIFAEVVASPSFPDAELARLRAQRLTALIQQRDNANAIAGTLYPTILYGAEHPYGHAPIGDEASLAAITREDVTRFYESHYRPEGSTLIVVGDVTPDTVVPMLERALAGWKGKAAPAIETVAPPSRENVGLYLVDRPGAAQSIVTIGHVGVQRATPDYYALAVLNTILGGQFSSRVNMNLRETKGYTYGARTSFDYRRGAGPFAATAGVQTAVTKESVVEFLKELRGIRGEIPVTPQELEFAKQTIIRGYPAGFETPQQIANRLAEVVAYGLPVDYFDTFTTNVAKVTKEDVERVARRYLDPSRMAILVVGDMKTVEPGLRSLAEPSAVTLLDVQGRPVPSSTGPGGASTP